MTDDEWVKLAIVEDAVVAELLSSLKESKPTPPPSGSTSAPEKQTLLFEWSVRQRRSKGVAVAVQTKKPTPMASPTTPLSWSGGATSISGGGCTASGSGRGFEVEESSQISPHPPSAPKSSDMARSKVNGPCEVSATKRIRKKKTLTELKEEEVLLERERRQLKRELMNIRDNLERERTRNENFKRMKQQQQHASSNPFCNTLPRVVVSNLGLIQQSSHNSYREGKMESAAGKFVLPDLNLTIEENHSGV